MANLLADASIQAQQVIAAVPALGPGAAGAAYAVSQISNIQQGQLVNVATTAGLSLISGSPIQAVGASALQSLTGVSFSFGAAGGLQGVKPVPLHTERAGSAVSGEQPYSFTQDIEFFLLRADQSAPQASAQQDSGQQASKAANTQGGNWLGKALQSPLGQLATGLATNAVLGAVQQKVGSNSLVGPLTGLGIAAGLSAATQTGIFSPAAAKAAGGSPSAVSNAVGTGPDAVGTAAATAAAQTQLQQYFAPSQDYWSQATAASFQTGAFSTDSTALNAFTGGANSALATDLGKNFSGVASNAQLGDLLNNGGAAAYSLPTGSLASVAGGAPQLNEDATTIQSKDTTADIPKSWYFITAPQDVSWSKEGKISTADTYGTNTPYVLYGSTSLRKLSLGNVMLEGFSDGKTVEANVVALETCMNMVIQKGYTAPYCWKVYTGGKSYGTFVITGVKVKEVMRDLRGFATRAFVDIELMQVPDYQVNSGRDLASKATLGGLSSEVKKLIAEQNKADKATSAAAGRGSRGAAGAGVAGAQDSAAAAAGGGGGGGNKSANAIAASYAARYARERGASVGAGFGGI